MGAKRSVSEFDPDVGLDGSSAAPSFPPVVKGGVHECVAKPREIQVEGDGGAKSRIKVRNGDVEGAQGSRVVGIE